MYGVETSKSAIKLLNLNLKFRQKIFQNLFLLNEKDKNLKFDNNFFDSIACISVISLLQSKKISSF